MEYEMVDPYNFIAKESLIRASQDYTLFTTPYARHDPKDDIQVHNDNDKDADKDKDKDKDNDSDYDMWDQSSDDDDVTHPDDVITITLCSPPPSPPNDVVSGVPGELGFESDQLNSLNDVVSDEFTVPTPIVDVEINDIEANSVNRPQIDAVSGDLGFQDVEIGGGDTQEVVFGDDTEELIECDANTEVISEDDEEVNTGRNSSEEVKECLLYLLRVLTEKQGNKEGDGDGVVDFLETAKRRGYTFPPPRWKFT